ncbi:MAG: hypothetical protein KME15_22660 [Drouetiella hepatica Uher 2000/2452]|jgi:hypothetical protein|uniref:Uncharacterized protein n=1 Tax=Drouetiella hepatica Uher 2000/2452 TaxID=904376 RepID=A0A951QF99_9CYAN|nr:hypothetical protein [Drouetiella hepatica Uher 2000/2452]
MSTPQNFSVGLLPGFDRIMLEHRLAGQQPDNLCGPYWVAVLLRSRGITLTPEQVAQMAGSILPTGNPETWLPSGANSRQDYCLALPEATDLREAGTSAQGLMAAVSALSDNAHRFVPLQADWTVDRLETVLQLCQNHSNWNAIPLCNLRTDSLWGASLPVGDAISYLSEEAIMPPPADWNVGHFLVLAGMVKGMRSLGLICDTYPKFGWQGYHLQPFDVLAQALNRGDGYGGGILLFISQSDQEEVELQFKQEGFAIECWDNGSPIV